MLRVTAKLALKILLTTSKPRLLPPAPPPPLPQKNRPCIKTRHLLLSADLLGRHGVDVVSVIVLLDDAVVHVEVDQSQDVRRNRLSALDTQRACPMSMGTPEVPEIKYRSIEDNNGL